MQIFHSSSRGVNHAQAQRGPSEPAFVDCELCAAAVSDDVADETGAAAEAARHLLVTGLLRQHYLAQGTCPAGVARELIRLLSSSADQQVRAAVMLRLAQHAERQGGSGSGPLVVGLFGHCMWLQRVALAVILLWHSGQRRRCSDRWRRLLARHSRLCWLARRMALSGRRVRQGFIIDLQPNNQPHAASALSS